MQLFTFDKYWNLTWDLLETKDYGCQYFDFYLVADKRISSRPFFSIYSGDEKVAGKLLLRDLNSDLLIMHVKSILETGKLIKH